MIKVCLADNYPIVHYGVKSYFDDHIDISIIAIARNINMVFDVLTTVEIDVLILDMELEGLLSFFEVKSILLKFPKTKIIIYSSLSEQIYGSNALKAGVSGFVCKNQTLETLEISIVKANREEIVINNRSSKSLMLITRQNNSQRLYRKLSKREMLVLLYFSKGKKSCEIAEILKLNQKTIGTYKLRLLKKLNVTNLIDMVDKAKRLEIVWDSLNLS
jgi:two-component system response regulator FimZ (fimbrial Z protein)